ncbi:MAG TPA: universal stress protein [Acidimicrobiales bacterium]|nr:universal stress protein [Acidimicrobiales bacterium]
MYREILVGTDGSPTASLAVDRAVEVAKALGSRLTIFSVDRPERAQKVVQDEATRLSGSGVEIRTLTAQGDPASTLVAEAEQGDYDLLVVGNKGMTGASRFFLGSVPNKVSHHIPCALLIVRTT